VNGIIIKLDCDISVVSIVKKPERHQRQPLATQYNDEQEQQEQGDERLKECG